ncbi:ABC transporter permease [Streptomyces sp. NPDC091272]|uniref:ABC transporter permease n=1 Tax=Streptomyces sp. NPDC091272 TaxID=3365981 RepID=UPI0038299BF1
MSGSTSVLRLPGPDRLVLRQSRWAGWAAGGLVVSAVVGTAVLRGVAGSDPYSPVRGTLRALNEDVAYAALLLPVLIGAFVAGPMLARELESGTYRLAWTQGMSPTRWLASKLAVAAVGSAAVAAVLMGAFRLGQGAFGPPGAFLHWHQAHAYAALGVTGVAYALLGVAFGALTALLVRRTVLAMVVAGAVTGALMMAMGSLRAHLWPTTTVTRQGEPGSVVETDGSRWDVDFGMLTGSGQRLSWESCWAGVREGAYPDSQACMTARGAVSHFSDVHTRSHFWPLQLVETGIVLALVAGAVWLAFRALRRLHG